MRTRANALVWNSSAVQSALAQISARHIPSVLGGPLFTVVALGYALCAAAACVGLWRMRPWASRAYAAWCVTAWLLGALFAFSELFPTGLVSWVLVAALTAFVFLSYDYVAKQTKSHVPRRYRQ
jgi:hypothetical protein